MGAELRRDDQARVMEPVVVLEQTLDGPDLAWLYRDRQWRLNPLEPRPLVARFDIQPSDPLTNDQLPDRPDCPVSYSKVRHQIESQKLPERKPGLPAYGNRHPDCLCIHRGPLFKSAPMAVFGSHQLYRPVDDVSDITFIGDDDIFAGHSREPVNRFVRPGKRGFQVVEIVQKILQPDSWPWAAMTTQYPLWLQRDGCLQRVEIAGEVCVRQRPKRNNSNLDGVDKYQQLTVLRIERQSDVAVAVIGAKIVDFYCMISRSNQIAIVYLMCRQRQV